MDFRSDNGRAFTRGTPPTSGANSAFNSVRARTLSSANSMRRTMSVDNMGSLFTSSDLAARATNERCYQRWHTVLQEGMVPTIQLPCWLCWSTLPCGT